MLGASRTPRAAPNGAAATDRAAVGRSSTTGPTTTGPSPNWAIRGATAPTVLCRSSQGAAEDADQLVAVDAGDDVEPGVAGGAPDAVDDGGGLGVRCQPGDGEDVGCARPPQGGGAREVVVADVAAHQRVREQGLEAGVPGAAHLGGLRVHLGGREGHLTGEDQDRFA